LRPGPGFLEEPADQPLAAAVAVHVRGVYERDTRVDGGRQRGESRVLIDLAPVTAQLPRAQADHADRHAGAAEYPLFHAEHATRPHTWV
jgi:hypothetical protein